jgi:chemotaxis protein methyltransferase CheR
MGTFGAIMLLVRVPSSRGDAGSAGRLIGMNEKQIDNEPTKSMSGREFERLSEFIMAQSGIKMPVSKKTMLESRLQKRLRALRLSSFREYCDILFHPIGGGGELVHMLDAVTTNKTDFFREPVHFSFLTDTVLPEFVSEAGQGSAKQFTVWSAGCSSGEEPYTLAIVLSEFAARSPGFQYAIAATDISTKVLEKAQVGIYDRHQAETVPPLLMQRYFMRSKDRDQGTVRVVPELRSRVQFRRLNLMDEHFLLFNGAADAIFCRNVIIYFDRDTQHRLLSRLSNSLKTGGYLFLGHSETIHGFDLPLIRIASTIYRKVL